MRIPTKIQMTAIGIAYPYSMCHTVWNAPSACNKLHHGSRGIYLAGTQVLSCAAFQSLMDGMAMCAAFQSVTDAMMSGDMYRGRYP